MLHRLGWALAGAMALVAVLALARATTAGPLDPPGPVGSTMRTLDELVPSWGRTLSSTGGCASQRFQCVMTGNAAVLDRETGIVWLRSPDTNYKDYEQATFYCNSTTHAGRYGWRLPTLNELYSLADDSGDDNLPDGNPFIDAGGGVYWSSTTWDDDDDFVVTLAFFGGFLEELIKAREGVEFSNAWCVRGGDSPPDDSSLDEIAPWSRTLSAEGGCSSQRFECVMNGTAVLDRETGLVWESAPLSSEAGTWQAAQLACSSRTTGGRSGWRPPSLSEASSLVLRNVGLPTGHPFTIPASTDFVTSTTGDSPTLGMAFDATGFFFQQAKIGSFPTASWCVRAPGGEDGND